MCDNEVLQEVGDRGGLRGRGGRGGRRGGRPPRIGMRGTRGGSGLPGRVRSSRGVTKPSRGRRSRRPPISQYQPQNHFNPTPEYLEKINAQHNLIDMLEVIIL